MHANGVFLPHGPDVGQCLRTARAEQLARHDTQIGVELFALSLLSVTKGLVPPVLAALGTLGGHAARRGGGRLPRNRGAAAALVSALA